MLFSGKSWYIFPGTDFAITIVVRHVNILLTCHKDKNLKHWCLKCRYTWLKVTHKNQFKETFSHASLTNCYVYVCHMVCKWWAKSIITACIPISHIIKLWKPPDFLKANIEKRWLGSQQGIKYVCLLISLHTLSEKYVGKTETQQPHDTSPPQWMRTVRVYVFSLNYMVYVYSTHLSSSHLLGDTLHHKG